MQQQQHSSVLTGTPVKVSNEIEHKINGSVTPILTDVLPAAEQSRSSSNSQQMTSPRTRSRSPPAGRSTFQPDLPPLPSPLETPIVRKRKASQDLTSNPLPKESKVELEGRFEDDSNERSSKPSPQPSTIEDEKAKKLRNAGTRTLWTLIMIFGFLSKLPCTYYLGDNQIVFSFVGDGSRVHDTSRYSLPIYRLP